MCMCMAGGMTFPWMRGLAGRLGMLLSRQWRGELGCGDLFGGMGGGWDELG